MANIKSIGGNPIVVGLDGLNDDAKVTLLANRPSATLSGSIVAADDASPTTPIDTIIYGQSTQDGTPTPSAPVPIVSVEGDSEGNISLWARGKNLADPTFPQFNYAPSRGVTYTKAADGTITVSGTADGLAYLQLSSSINNPFSLVPGETYTISTTSTSGDIYALTTGGSRTALPHTFEYGNEGYNVGLCVKSGDTVNESFKVMLQHGSTATAYQPYTATVTPIDLDGHELRSLPDGTRDELTVDAEGHVTLVQRVGAIDLGGRTWNAYSSGQGKTYYANVTGTAPEKAAGASNVMCASYALGTAGTSLDDGQMIGGANNNRVYIRDDRYTTEADFKAGMSGVTLNYALATPVTHDLGTVALVPLVGPDLTAQTVPTAPFALTYERDATITIDRLTAMWANVAPVEGDTASANYSVGSYLMHGGQLCKVTTAIATGETIAIGTNVVTTTVMAEVVSLTQ